MRQKSTHNLKMVHSIEKRRKLRQDSIENPAFVEIHHTHGSVSKSVYNIIEFDEFGLSFLVPEKDGYFLIGTPLSLSIVNPDRNRSNHFGVIRHYRPYFKENGARCYRVGIELQPEYRDALNIQLGLRSRRYNPKKESKSAIEFEFDGSVHCYELIDFSKYSAAFACLKQEMVNFKMSSLLTRVVIIVQKKVLFSGSAIITRVYEDNQKRYRIVIEPRGQTIHVEMIEKLAATSGLAEELNNFLRLQKSYDSLDNRFKAIVADIRLFLEQFRAFLSTASVAALPELDSEEWLGELFSAFREQLDKKFRTLDRLIPRLRLSADIIGDYKAYYQHQLLPLILSSPLSHRSYFKPLGYPGDYDMLRMAYEDKFVGATTFEKLVHRWNTSIAYSQASRERAVYLANMISKQASVKHNSCIMSLGSGPAIEYALLFKQDPHLLNGLNLTLLDKEIQALTYAKEMLYELKIRSGSDVSLGFINQNIEEYMRGSSQKPSKQFDLIYAAGLFDYFNDSVTIFILKKLMHFLNPGGQIVIANVSVDGHNHRTYLEFSFDWYVVYRSKKDLQTIAESIPRISRYDIHDLAGGVIKFLHLYV